MAGSISANCLISPEPLLKEFHCPICLNVMRDIWVTSCFHRFCEECIKESVNAMHRCPLCNNQLENDNIQRDAQYNTLLEAINKGIQEAESKKAASFADQVAKQIGDNTMRETLEELFRDTLVSSLANHLTSANDMQIRYKRKKRDIEEKYNKTLNQLKDQALPKDEYKKQLQEKTAEFNAEMNKLEEENRNVQILFIQAYKRHLNEQVSNFHAVSTQVRVTLWKGDRLWKFPNGQHLLKQMRPEDRMEVLLHGLDELVQANNDKLMNIGDMVFFTCVSSFDDLSDKSLLERLNAMQSLSDPNNDDDDDVDDSLLTVSRNCRPILEHKLLRGTLVVIHGDILLESEIPKQCFIQVYNENPGHEHLVDYFACEDCKKDGKPLRWICKSCATVCHKNHHITPLIFQNRASGPKCECRKKNCLIYSRK